MAARGVAEEAEAQQRRAAADSAAARQHCCGSITASEETKKVVSILLTSRFVTFADVRALRFAEPRTIDRPLRKQYFAPCLSGAPRRSDCSQQRVRMMTRCKRFTPSLGAQQRAVGGSFRRGFALPPRRERSGAAPAPPSAFPPLLILRTHRFSLRCSPTSSSRPRPRQPHACGLRRRARCVGREAQGGFRIRCAPDNH